MSRRGAVSGRGGGSPRPLALARVPGARASPGWGDAGSREAPPAALAPGRGSREALFRARPPASQAQPTRPFPSPCLRSLTGVASGTPAGPPLAAALGRGVGIWDLNYKLSDRWGSQFCQKERMASRLLYFPFRCPLFSLLLPLFFLFPPCLSWALKAPDNDRPLARCGWTVIGRRILSRRLHRRVEVWRAVISQVLPRDGELGALSREPPHFSHSSFYPTCACFPCLLLTRIS